MCCRNRLLGLLQMLFQKCLGERPSVFCRRRIIPLAGRVCERMVGVFIDLDLGVFLQFAQGGFKLLNSRNGYPFVHTPEKSENGHLQGRQFFARGLGDIAVINYRGIERFRECNGGLQGKKAPPYTNQRRLFWKHFPF